MYFANSDGSDRCYLEHYASWIREASGVRRSDSWRTRMPVDGTCRFKFMRYGMLDRPSKSTTRNNMRYVRKRVDPDIKSLGRQETYASIH